MSLIENMILKFPTGRRDDRRRQARFRIISAVSICLVFSVLGPRPQADNPGPFQPPASNQSAATAESSALTPDEAVQRLTLGNRRFLSNTPKPKHNSLKIRDLANGQHPFAVVFCCSDSRVVPEILFDAGLGEVFTIRLAGNVTDIAGIAGAEYAVEHLGTRLIVVLGHTSCGAVEAAVDHLREGRITDLVRDIEPALAGLSPTSLESRTDLVSRAARANVLYQIRHLRENSLVLAEEVARGRIKILGGMYDLTTGDARFFDGDGVAISITDERRTAARRPTQPHIKRKVHRHAPHLRGR